MAARKKASKKGSGTITKKTKAPVRSTASRKRKPSAAASAPRRTAKAKTARNAKAKTDKVEAKRRGQRRRQASRTFGFGGSGREACRR